jgi:hypothetical protein
MIQELSSAFGREGLFWLVVGLIVLGVVIANQWRKIRQAEIQAALKQDMLERGMSAEEIKLVLEAGQKCRSRSSGQDARAPSGGARPGAC